MKKKFSLATSMLLLTGSMFYFSGCKKTVENLINEQCTICTETATGTAQDEFCSTEALVVTYESTQQSLGFTCQRQ
jgi:hypothetical protein